MKGKIKKTPIERKILSIIQLETTGHYIMWTDNTVNGLLDRAGEL